MLLKDTILWGYPHIGRIFQLSTGIRELFEGPFWVDVKVDGYSVRVVGFEDVISTGAAALKAVQACQKEGYQVLCVYACLLNRLLGIPLWLLCISWHRHQSQDLWVKGC